MGRGQARVDILREAQGGEVLHHPLHCMEPGDVGEAAHHSQGNVVDTVCDCTDCRS